MQQPSLGVHRDHPLDHPAEDGPELRSVLLDRLDPSLQFARHPIERAGQLVDLVADGGAVDAAAVGTVRDRLGDRGHRREGRGESARQGRRHQEREGHRREGAQGDDASQVREAGLQDRQRQRGADVADRGRPVVDPDGVISQRRGDGAAEARRRALAGVASGQHLGAGPVVVHLGGVLVGVGHDDAVGPQHREADVRRGSQRDDPRLQSGRRCTCQLRCREFAEQERVHP